MRIVVSFVVAPDAGQSRLTDGATIWGRDDLGAWRPLTLTARPKQLLCLLVAYGESGVAKTLAARYLEQSPGDIEPEESDVADRDGPARSALRGLRTQLQASGVGQLAALLDSGRGRNARWSIERAVSDIDLAGRALRAGEWEALWVLTHGGDGRVVGSHRDNPRRRRPLTPLKLRAERELNQLLEQVLPRRLLEEGDRAASAAIEHYAGAARTPVTVDEPIPKILHELTRDAASGREPVPAELQPPEYDVDLSADQVEVIDEPPTAIARLALHTMADELVHSEPQQDDLVPESADALFPTRETTIRETSPYPVRFRRTDPGAESDIVVIRPLRVPPRSRTRTIRLLAGAVIVLIGVAAVLAILRRGVTVSSTTGQRARIEVQSYVGAANTFADPTNLTGLERLPKGTTVLVSCRRFINGPQSTAPYWWYRIADGPRRGRWVPANSFLNGDPASDYLGPHPHPPKHQHGYDAAVATCGSGVDGSTETPRDRTIETFANPHTGATAGPPIDDTEPVTVSCKATSNAPGSEPGGEAYRLASPPWNGRYYAPARAFTNAFPPDSKLTELVDLGVPDCPG